MVAMTMTMTMAMAMTPDDDDGDDDNDNDDDDDDDVLFMGTIEIGFYIEGGSIPPRRLPNSIDIIYIFK